MTFSTNFDTSPYVGIFVRQYIGQTPANIGQGTCYSPDIIVDNTYPTPPAPGSYATQNDYTAPNPHPNNVTLNNQNYVYMRGLQANGYTGGTNFFFYYVESDLALWPQNWALATNVTTGSANPPGSYVNHVYAPAPTSGQIVLGDQPILWTPKPPSAGNHYCVISWADNSTEANPEPPDLSYFGQMSSFNDLMAFLGSHPNMGWQNTSDYPAPPPNDIYQTNISTQAQAETINIIVNFINIATGTFTVNLFGENISYTSGQLNVANYQGGFQVPQQAFPANVSATLQVIYNQAGTPLGQYSRISASITQTVTPEIMEFFEPMFVNSSITLPIRKMRLKMEDGSLAAPSDQFILGSQNWNLNFT